jgi:hypothetical protein
MDHDSEMSPQWLRRWLNAEMQSLRSRRGNTGRDGNYPTPRSSEDVFVFVSSSRPAAVHNPYHSPYSPGTTMKPSSGRLTRVRTTSSSSTINTLQAAYKTKNLWVRGKVFPVQWERPFLEPTHQLKTCNSPDHIIIII